MVPKVFGAAASSTFDAALLFTNLKSTNIATVPTAPTATTKKDKNFVYVKLNNTDDTTDQLLAATATEDDDETDEVFFDRSKKNFKNQQTTSNKFIGVSVGGVGGHLNQDSHHHSNGLDSFKLKKIINSHRMFNDEVNDEIDTVTGNGNVNATTPVQDCDNINMSGGDGDDDDFEPLILTPSTSANKLHGAVESTPSMASMCTSTDTIVSDHKDVHANERWFTIAFQVFIPYIIAGFGMVGAGLVLDRVQHWELFQQLKEIYVLVPALLGLKGNLEMTLASRFSTQANLGLLNTRKDIFKAIAGNLLLTQAQAIVVGLLASFAAILLSLIRDKQLNTIHAVVLTASSISTASMATLLLAALMMVVILISTRLHINPDNIATPLAASLGDLVTLVILSSVGTFLYQIRDQYWIHLAIIACFLTITPLFICFSNKNDYVRDALHHGWVPIIAAMCISSVGGMILGYAVDRFKGIAVFQPVINGVGGNLAAVFASRLSTTLHRTSTLGQSADWAPTSCLRVPFDTFFAKKNFEAKAARVLILISLPGHIIFLFTISKIKAGHILITGQFIIAYLIVAIAQIQLLLFFCYWFVHFVWKRKMNPDNVCIPYITALGDFLGTAFLALAFYSLPPTDLKDPHTLNLTP